MHNQAPSYSISTGDSQTFTLAPGAQATINTNFPNYSNNEELRGTIYLVITSSTHPEPAVTGIGLGTHYHSPGSYDFTNASGAPATFTAQVVSDRQ